MSRLIELKSRLPFLTILVLVVVLGCRFFNTSAPTSQPTYTSFPTYTAFPTPIPIDFSIEFHMFYDFLYDAAFFEIENRGEMSLETKTLSLSNPDTSEVYIEVNSPEFSDGTFTLEPGESKIIEVELAYHDEVGTQYIASLNL